MLRDFFCQLFKNPPVNLEGSSVLSELLTTFDFKDKGYRQFFQQTPGNTFEQATPAGTSWSESISSQPRLAALFKDALKDQILLDLGAGSKMGKMYEFASALGARAYVAVDKSYNRMSGGSSYVNLAPQYEIEEVPGCKLVVIKSDMLEFLSKVKTASCAVTINAIDSTIIADSEYHLKLADEITRVVAPGRIAFGILSEALVYLSTSCDPPAPVLGLDSGSGSVFSRIGIFNQSGICRPGWEDHTSLIFDKVLKRVGETA